MKVKIKNFQIIEDEELEFKEGLTILVGDTHNGKSSIFRAIKYAVFNELGEDFIQFGKDKTDVIIEEGDNVVEWEKPRGSGAEYKINGESYSKVGRTQFEKVADILKMKEIKLTSNKSEKLNFWKQMKYPFLLDMRASQLYEFLSLLSENDNLTEVLEDMKSDLRDLKNDKNKVDGGIDSLKDVVRKEEEYLETKKGFDEVYTKIIDIESDFNKYKDLKIKYNDLLETQKKWRDVKLRKDKLGNFIGGLEPLLNDLNKYINQYHNLYSDYKDLKVMDNKVKDVRKKKKNVNEIIENINIENLDRMLNKYIKLNNEVENLNKNYSELKEIINKKDKIKKEKERKESQIESVDIKVIKEKLNRYKSIEEERQEMEKYKNRLDSLESSYRNVKKSKNKIEKKIEKMNEKISEFDVCPLCGNKLNGEE